MRLSSLIMILLALVFGGLAVLLSHRWLADQAAALRKQEVAAALPQEAPAPKNTIVVAARALAFGTRLTPDVLKEIPWNAEDRPEGSFARVSEITGGENPRAVLQPLAANELILSSRITGEGQRATLSAVLGSGKSAITVPVTVVSGVGGFVLPGDRVDLLVTREMTRGEDRESFTDVVLQDLRVLGVDQTADTTSENPVVAKAVTLEVTTEEAQKAALAQNLGTLSLALRPLGASGAQMTRRITETDLTPQRIIAEAPPVIPAALKVEATPPAAPPMSTIGVTRGLKRQEYAVPRIGTGM